MRLPKLCNNGTRIWEAKDKEKLKDLYYEGYTDEEIAEVLGRTKKAISRVRAELKLKARSRGNKEFVIHDAMGDYLPKWWKDILKKRWEERYMK